MTRVVELSSEQLEKYCTEGTMMEALGQWMVDEGPLTWNTLQKGIALIRARYLGRDPATVVPEGVQYPKWSSSLWDEVSQNLLGPEWRDVLSIGCGCPKFRLAWPKSTCPRRPCAGRDQ